MAIPISYNFRNLMVRKTTTIMTAFGIALTVAVLLAVLSLIEGLKTAFAATGHPLQLLVMRKGSTAELNSNLSREAYQDIKFKPGIARTKSGEPMASLEMITVINLASPANPDGMNVTVRGLLPVGLEMREGVKLIQGRWFQQGRREVVVGKSVASRYPAAKLGGKLSFARGDWDVVGVMDAGQSALNSEIFADLNQVSSDFNRTEVLSSALIRATDRVAMRALTNDLENDPRLNVMAPTEREYYDNAKQSGMVIQFLGTFIAIIMAIGSAFAAMNTMYASVARRSAEIGTLRVLGFSRGAILTSFFLESVLLCLIGGVIGVVMVLPLNNITTGIGSWVSFSEVAFNFQVSPKIMLTGLLFALLMGAAGGFFPARFAAKKEILAALREG